MKASFYHSVPILILCGNLPAGWQSLSALHQIKRKLHYYPYIKMGLAQSLESIAEKDSPTTSRKHSQTILDHSSVSTLRAVTDATLNAITNGPTTWNDVENYLAQFGHIDISIREEFPNARVVSDLAEITNKALESRGFTAENTLFAASVCPDEINHVYNNLPQMLAIAWGECFQMGGLAGVPFCGQTGFGAFAAHIPDDGHLFILFAPHIGICPKGNFGMYSRDGQTDCCSTACGACVGAFNHIQKGGLVPDFAHLGEFPFDYQQQWLISQLAKKVDVINAAENKMVELAKQMYYIIENFMSNIVSMTNISDAGSVVLLGGVHINTMTPMEDFFWPLKFEIRRNKQQPENLLHLLRPDLCATGKKEVTNTTQLLLRSFSSKKGMDLSSMSCDREL